MIQFPRRWQLKDQISYLERKILLNSILYYDYDTNELSDHEYNEISQQLANLVNVYPQEVKNSLYGYVFTDFEGSTGFDLCSKLTKQDKEYLQAMVEHRLGNITLHEVALKVNVKQRKGKLF